MFFRKKLFPRKKELRRQLFIGQEIQIIVLGGISNEADPVVFAIYSCHCPSYSLSLIQPLCISRPLHVNGQTNILYVILERFLQLSGRKLGTKIAVGDNCVIFVVHIFNVLLDWQFWSIPLTFSCYLALSIFLSLSHAQKQAYIIEHGRQSVKGLANIREHIGIYWSLRVSPTRILVLGRISTPVFGLLHTSSHHFTFHTPVMSFLFRISEIGPQV